MSERIFYCVGQTGALRHCVNSLQQEGCVFAQTAGSSVTHLLLDVPCKDTTGLPELLVQLPKDITVIGGNLRDPALQGYNIIDLLQDPLYLAQNANITAHGAVKLALGLLPVTLDRCCVLVIGWGRIGKCLARLLRQMGALVTVAARKETDRAMLTAMGYKAVDLSFESSNDYRVIFNTVPAPVLKDGQCSAGCLKLELASLPGMAGGDVINARALPNRCAPESSGELIARSILRLLR
ncbi:MAG: hypothetical protein IJZ56_03980 [Oscillospiraceae bacterium]|nr:hypothetical protein [Oscillospiraceae bacterium]